VLKRRYRIVTDNCGRYRVQRRRLMGLGWSNVRMVYGSSLYDAQRRLAEIEDRITWVEVDPDTARPETPR